jgi:hypothetical protein
VVPDATCPAGERFSKYADPELAGSCFDGDGDGTTSTSEGTSTLAESSSGESSSSSGEPPPVELCNGVDDNLDGLVDEWSPQNVECEICPPDNECRPCDLFPDDEADPTRVYFMCHGNNYNEVIRYCADMNAPAVSIHDDAENTFLAIKVAEYANYNTAYIGLRDFGKTGSPMWTWVDGSEFGYERLGAQLMDHAPDDVCAAITSAGVWEAAHCFGGRTYICEAELPSAQ